MNDKNLYNAHYTYGNDGWVQLTPEMLAALYENKRKAELELAQCAEYYVELAVEASGMKDANEVLNHIMSKK